MSQITIRRLLQVILLAMVAMIAACSSSNSQVIINPDTGRHIDNWQNPDVHGASAKSNLDSSNSFSTCQTCHGTLFNGGTSLVSCFPCHGVQAPHPARPWRGSPRTHTNTDPKNAPGCAFCHTNGANSTLKPATPAPAGASPGCFNNTLCHSLRPVHPAGWKNPDLHGTAAKAAPDTLTSFSVCQVCHGSDFSGGTVQMTCLNTCHGVSAPHPAKPWRSPLTARTHTTTNPLNAPACSFCHMTGANSSKKPEAPPEPGAIPGCFNNTLCHGQRPVHPPGWESPDQHGVSAKAAPDGMTGFFVCQLCHGSDFSGGGTLVTCLNNSACHRASAPHPAKPWRSPLTARSHTTTDPRNGPVCGLCHANGANSPEKPSIPAPVGTPAGCFNSTLCHGGRPAHPPGWVSPDQHGASAKKATDTTTGFFTCQVCHGNDFTGGNVQVTCLATCHGVSAPHSPKPWRAPLTQRTHTTTDSVNGPVCGLCHTNGANSSRQPTTPAPPGTAPGCFNNTLCHGQIDPHPAGWSSPAQHGSEAKSAPTGSFSGFSSCQVCHGNTFTGGTSGLSCFGCHGVSAPHPASWEEGTFSHTSTNQQNASVCVICHANGNNSPLPPPSPPAAPGTAPGCFNATLCHRTP